MMSRAPKAGRWGWWLTTLAICILSLSLLLGLSGVAFYRESEYTDLLISHLPNARFIHNALVTWRQIPLWNPTILSGAPLAADPLSGLAYPPNWLAFVFPLPLTFNLLLLVHLCWAALGCTILARQAGLSSIAGVFFGVAFAGTPKIMAHLGLGHVSLVSAVCWTPWLLVSITSMVEATGSWYLKKAVQTGLVLGVIFLADPRWAIPGLLLGLSYALHQWLQLPFTARGNSIRWGRSLLVVGCISLGVAALLAIPLWEYLSLSTRASLPSEAADVFALDGGHLLGLFHPFLSQAEQVTYVGIPVLILALIGVFHRSKGTGFWGGVFIVSILLSFGSATPLYSLFSQVVPGAGLLRVPSRMFFLSAFSAATLAGYGIEGILKIEKTGAGIRRSRLVMVGLIALVVFINLGFAWIGVGTTGDLFLITLVAVLVGSSIELILRGRILADRGMLILLIVMVFDLAWINKSMLRIEPYPELTGKWETIRDISSGSYGEQRIFSPSYAISQDLAVDAHLEMVNGVNPLQLASYHAYFQRATGFDASAYDVTLPPISGGDPKKPWGLALDPDLLGRLNVSIIVSDYPLLDEGISLIEERDDLYLYDLDETRPRAWIEPGSTSWEPVEEIQWSPNQIRVRAQGPALLVLSEIQYPGWRVYIDDERAEMETSESLFRAVRIAPGEQLVTFRYQPLSHYLGGLIFTLSLVMGLVLGRRR